MLEHTVATVMAGGLVISVNSKLFFLSAQAVLQQHRTTRSSAFAQASLRQWFYYAAHAEHAFLWGPVVFGSRLESNSNTAHFSGGERLQLIDFQACETKRAAFGGRGITACPTEVVTIEQKQRVRQRVSSFISWAQGPGSHRPESWKVEGGKLRQFQ